MKKKTVAKKVVAKKVTKKVAKSIAKKVASFWNSHPIPDTNRVWNQPSSLDKKKKSTSPSWPAPISEDIGYGRGYGTHSSTDDSDKKTEWVLVETISTFRNRYMIEVPVGKKEWALDTVTMNEAKEFSQKYLDETIVSERVLGHDDAIKLFDEDNDYLASWDTLKKMETGFTSIADLDKKNESTN